MICIVDYGIGNIGSIINMFKKGGILVKAASQVNDFSSATKIILPGVGHFDACMEAFNQSGLKEIVEKKVTLEKLPTLGICVGYQMLCKSSEEGRLSGLGWLDAQTVKFNSTSPDLKIPHMGWNSIVSVSESEFAKKMMQSSDEYRAYFVHSYYVKPNDQAQVLFETNYIHNFASGMQADNIIGVQFHPEKSHRYGLNLFKTFAEL